MWDVAVRREPVGAMPQRLQLRRLLAAIARGDRLRTVVVMDNHISDISRVRSTLNRFYEGDPSLGLPPRRRDLGPNPWIECLEAHDQRLDALGRCRCATSVVTVRESLQSSTCREVLLSENMFFGWRMKECLECESWVDLVTRRPRREGHHKAGHGFVTSSDFCTRCCSYYGGEVPIGVQAGTLWLIDDKLRHLVADEDEEEEFMLRKVIWVTSDVLDTAVNASAKFGDRPRIWGGEKERGSCDGVTGGAACSGLPVVQLAGPFLDDHERLLCRDCAGAFRRGMPRAVWYHGYWRLPARWLNLADELMAMDEAAAFMQLVSKGPPPPRARRERGRRAG